MATEPAGLMAGNGLAGAGLAADDVAAGVSTVACARAGLGVATVQMSRASPTAETVADQCQLREEGVFMAGALNG